MKDALLFATIALAAAILGSFGLAPREARIVLWLGIVGTILSVLIYALVWSLRF